MNERAQRLQGTIERRALDVHEFELRADGGTLTFRGYASLFNTPYEVLGGPDKGGWTETVNPKAFDRTLRANPDVSLNVNHGGSLSGLPIARTTAPGPMAKLTLTTDRRGLKPEAPLDPSVDDDVRQLQQKMDLGLVNEMSFAFRTNRQAWNDDYTERELLELDLNKGDVSVVTNGANDATSSQLRNYADALTLLGEADVEDALVEMRALEEDPLRALSTAQETIGRLIASLRPSDQRRLSVAQAERLMLLDA